LRRWAGISISGLVRPPRRTKLVLQHTRLSNWMISCIKLQFNTVRCAGSNPPCSSLTLKKTGGVCLLEGGIESGFNHVKPESFTPRLLHLKGRTNIRVTQVPIEAKSFNEGDVFVLDAGLNLYQFQGKGAGKNEKARAGQLCRAIDDERKGKPQVHVFSQTDKNVREFWDEIAKFDSNHSGWTNGVPSISPDDGKDEEWEKSNDQKLFKLSDESGSLQFTEVTPETKGKYKSHHLKTEDVFIFDTGNEIFAWIGKGASAGEKREAMQRAQDYLKKSGKNPNLPVTKILEGADSNAFKSFFTG